MHRFSSNMQTVFLATLCSTSIIKSIKISSSECACVCVCLFTFLYVYIHHYLRTFYSAGPNTTACWSLRVCVFLAALVPTNRPIWLGSPARKWQQRGLSVSYNACLSGGGYAISKR